MEDDGRVSEISEIPWWKRGVVYQVYPRSFQDSDGDGIGDLAGILYRLDYLAELGLDAIWISPIFPSPMADFGYDVSNYVDIDATFGDLKTFDRLVAAAHERGLRVILDYVPNHTSDQHPWFLESRASRTNPKRDWYIWRQPRPGGGVQNNWTSEFGGPAWSFDELTGEYYYHAYLEQQPDLNDLRSTNVAAQAQDPRSLLALYRALLALRRSHLALETGSYASGAATEHVLTYERHQGGQQLVVALNFGPLPCELRVAPCRILLSTELDRAAEPVERCLVLRGHEGIVAAKSRSR
jgi:glycosidase